jgi:heme-degrading monooxygenase HmoA
VPPPQYLPGQVVTVFRSRLRPEHEADYEDHAAEMLALARLMPGLVDIKDFTAGDGERVSIITFADEATEEAWRLQVDHLAAQRQGRAAYFAWYSLQVCSTRRVSGFEARAEQAEQAEPGG